MIVKILRVLHNLRLIVIVQEAATAQNISQILLP